MVKDIEGKLYEKWLRGAYNFCVMGRRGNDLFSVRTSDTGPKGMA